MKYIIAIASIFSFSLSCSATPHLLDMLIMKNDTFFFYTSPLAQKSNLIERDSNFIKNRILTTANRRGYVASWELIEDQIFLTKISDVSNGRLEADLQTIFETQDYNKRIKANWINDEMVVHSKNSMEGYRIGFSNVYEQEFVLKFKNGRLISRRTLNNEWAKKPNDNTSILNKFIINKLPKRLEKQLVNDSLEHEFYTYVTFDSNWEIKSIEFTKTEFETTELQKLIEKFNDWKFVYKKGELMMEYAVKLQINNAEIKKNKKCW